MQASNERGGRLMAQLDLGDGFYYQQGYGIYCLDLDQLTCHLVISEEKLAALDKWLRIVQKGDCNE